MPKPTPKINLSLSMRLVSPAWSGMGVGSYAKPEKDRISATDKAVLDLKARMRKVRTYVDKLEN